MTAKRWAAFAVVIALGAVAFGVLVARPDGPMPPFVASDDDPHALPPPGTNGWSSMRSVVVPDSVACVDAATWVQNIGETSNPAYAWEHIEESARVATSCVEGAQMTEVLDAWHEATQADAFVLESGEDAFKLAELIGPVLVEAATLVLDEQWADADEALAASLRSVVSAARGTRWTVTTMAALHAIESVVAFANLVTVRHGWEHFPALAVEVSKLEEQPLGWSSIIDRGIRGDYLHSRSIVSEDARRQGLFDRLRYDPIHTARLLDTAYVRFVRKRGPGLMVIGDEEDEFDTRCGPLEKLYNADGCAWANPDELLSRNLTTVEQLEAQTLVIDRWLRRLADSLPRRR